MNIGKKSWYWSQYLLQGTSALNDSRTTGNSDCIHIAGYRVYTVNTVMLSLVVIGLHISRKS